ncbi:hypothetical protein P8C59_007836 [Phyllachora maydis]|uniref:Arylamine N-acetyltransferase n=1 Tax=Phyllachora maydis TaxID=1825666 RepID=A0AAD9IB25_9PEZI|nr:hypothetical protein P8C59_007836 [Phyllachora maydis]
MDLPTYTPAQLHQYLAHIEYPSDPPAVPIDGSLPPAAAAAAQLALLTALARHHLARVPFESLALHYSPQRHISLDPAALFQKVVSAGRGRGGYCMEVNGLFGTVLRSLGFARVAAAAARVDLGAGFRAWGHMVNLVTLPDGARYLVDVGFGSRTPHAPLRLRDDGRPEVLAGRWRLERTRLREHSDPGPRAWVLSTRAEKGDGEAAGWTARYAVSEEEWFPEDFAMVNLFVSTAPQSYFVQTVMVVKALLNEDRTRVVGEMILHKDYVKRKLGRSSSDDGAEDAGETEEMLERMETEAQRVRALEKYFGIVLTPAEQAAITGLPSEIRGGRKEFMA